MGESVCEGKKERHDSVCVIRQGDVSPESVLSGRPVATFQRVNYDLSYTCQDVMSHHDSYLNKNEISS